MPDFPELDGLVAEMAAHGDVQVLKGDIRIDPQTTVPDTLLYVTIPGAKVTPERGGPEYTHCIHRYRVIGGDDITWVGPGYFGSTTRGSFGDNVYDDDFLEKLWEDILSQLGISPDPHARPE
ncbi:hypothetical protein [Mycolicibacterium fortuitum]|uniref:hypothetical protein n=1 Tax=Mycolicibacterium fortuitum TaxID=1766 RepID=UPI0026323087|nr:hypothetical protein [Mycolicibacterium fortuitum]